MPNPEGREDRPARWGQRGMMHFPSDRWDISYTYKIHFPLGLLNSPVVLGPEFLWIETQLWLPDIWFLGEHVGEPMVNPHIWSKKTPLTLRPCAWGGGDRIQGPTDFQWGVWAKILGDVGRESSGRDCGFEWIW